MVSYEESLTPVKQFPISYSVWGDRNMDLEWNFSGLFGTGSRAAKNGVGIVQFGSKVSANRDRQ